MNQRRLVAFVLALALSLSIPAGLFAADDAGFFNGKTITYVVATKPGGGYDAYGRLVAKYMQKHIPGSTVIVKNVPGAGHIIGANEVYLAKPDGLTVGTFNTGLVYSQIIGQEGIRFDLGKYSWIGKAASGTGVCIVDKRTPFKTLADLKNTKEPAKMASAGIGTSGHNETLIIGEVFGLNLKVVPGYGGREPEMAMLRGEVAGQFGSYDSLRTFIKTEGCRIVVQYGAKKHPEMPDVPLALDQPVSPQAKKLLYAVASISELWRLTAAPPNVPAGRLAVLREAYEKALTDPELLEEAKKMKIDITPGFGDEVGKLIIEAVNQPPENVAWFKNTIKVD